MGDSRPADPIAPADRSADSSALGRRSFLAKAAAVGAVAWAAPAIITMKPAGAASLTSPPPTPPAPVGPTGETPPTHVGDETKTATDPSGPTTQVKAASTGTLPFTGANVKDLLATGLAATAGGGALMFWSADRPDQLTPAPVVDPENGALPPS